MASSASTSPLDCPPLRAGLEAVWEHCRELHRAFTARLCRSGKPVLDAVETDAYVRCEKEIAKELQPKLHRKPWEGPGCKWVGKRYYYAWLELRRAERRHIPLPLPPPDVPPIDPLVDPDPFAPIDPPATGRMHRAINRLLTDEPVRGGYRVKPLVAARQYAAIRMAYYDDLTHQEIAEKLGVNIHTVGQLIANARARLAQFLEDPRA